jgi:hypothetical protein
MPAEIVLVLTTLVAPLAAAVAAAWLARATLPANIAERYSLGIALAVGFFLGYWLLPDWAPLVPEKHWQWLPYLGAAAVLGGLTQATGVSGAERLLAYGVLALVAAWQLVPMWEGLQPTRPNAVPLLAGYLLLVAALLTALPDRLLGTLMVGLLTTSAGATALLIAVGVSVKYGQVAAIATAAMAGCAVTSLLPKLTRRASEGSADQPPNAIRGLIPVFTILVGGLAFVGGIEPSPPMPMILVAPAAPLMHWLFAAGPLARLTGSRAVAAQSAAVLLPLVIAIAWVALDATAG